MLGFVPICKATALTNGDRRNDEGIAVEQRRRLGRHISAEILQQQFFLLGESLRLLLGRHFRWFSVKNRVH